MHLDFSITLGEIAAILSILTGSCAIVWGLHNLTQAVAVTHWEHKVVWSWFLDTHPDYIPPYPHLPSPRRRHPREH